MTRWRSEQIVEQRLKRRVEETGGVCEKHVNPGYRGDPDRLCSWPSGYVCFVETKWAPGVSPEPHQLRRHKHWRDHGLPVFVAGCDDDIDAVLRAAGVRPR